MPKTAAQQFAERYTAGVFDYFNTTSQTPNENAVTLTRATLSAYLELAYTAGQRQEFDTIDAKIKQRRADPDPLTTLQAGLTAALIFDHMR